MSLYMGNFLAPNNKMPVCLVLWFSRYFSVDLINFWEGRIEAIFFNYLMILLNGFEGISL